MEWLSFIVRCAVVSLAAKAVVTAWLDEGGIFDGPREWFVAFGEMDDDDRAPSILERIRSRLAQLATCRLCLGYHSAFWLFLLTLVGDAAMSLGEWVEMTPTLSLVAGGIYWIAMTPVLSFAATGIYQFLVATQDVIDGEEYRPVSSSGPSETDGGESDPTGHGTADE
jgi:hypothetical protein